LRGRSAAAAALSMAKDATVAVRRGVHRCAFTNALAETGGAAWAKIDSSLAVIGSPINSGVFQSDRRTGWTIGGGLEYALGYGWSAKSEFLYVDFGNWTTLACTAPSPGCAAGSITSLNTNLKDYIWRAGLNYKFW